MSPPRMVHRCPACGQVAGLEAAEEHGPSFWRCTICNKLLKRAGRGFKVADGRQLMHEEATA